MFIKKIIHFVGNLFFKGAETKFSPLGVYFGFFFKKKKIQLIFPDQEVEKPESCSLKNFGWKGFFLSKTEKRFYFSFIKE